MKKSKSITTTNTTSVQLLNGTRLNMANALHCQIGLNPNSLLGDSFLSRGDGGILVGQSAVGKSTFALQMACYLAIGKDFFGLKSTFGKPLKVLLVQSENGAEEVTEVLQSITQHWSAKEKQQLESQLAVEIIWDSRGADFGKWLRNILPEHNPDLVIVDPLMSYLGADVLSNEAITKFLRENINKVLKNPPVGCQSFGLLFVHHTGKPNSNGKKEEKPTREARMYNMMGASELVNWARCIMRIEAAPDRVRFFFLIPKRGNRTSLPLLPSENEHGCLVQHSRPSTGSDKRSLRWEAAEIPVAINDRDLSRLPLKPASPDSVNP